MTPSVKAVAREFHITRQTAAKHLRDRGVTTVRRMSEADIARAAAMYKQGDSAAVIGRSLGFSAHTVAVIRAEIENDYLYRLQTNVDGTIQFTIMLELPRPDDRRAKIAVGLKYFPDRRQLNLVTLMYLRLH